MALIKCPECKKKISDQCEKCPNCGYPIDKICEADKNQITDIENVDDGTARGKKSFDIKSLLKKWWFWVAVGVVIVAIAVTTILLLNRDTKPKFDKDGKPMFVELTNEVYTNAEDYLGYHINIKGKVFQVMSDNGKVKGIQIWLDPDTCEQNMMIYYNSDVEVKQGDYIMCSGYIDSVTEYKNAYDATRHAPLVFSSDLRKATYMEVMAPTIATITPENLKQEKYGYAVSIDKIEFAEKETRVYATVINNGKALLYFGGAVIVQEGKQYNSTDNYEAEYEKIPYEVVKGVSSSGIIVFPTISTNDFELTIDVHSDDYDEKIEKFVFKLSKDEIVTEKPAESSPVTPTTTSSKTQTKKPKNRNNEAIREAENLAETFFPTNRDFIRELLINPSAELGFEGFADSEADYAIENSSIDWNKHVLDYVMRNYSDETRPYNIYYGLSSCYTDSEIQYAINHCGIDWNKAAIYCVSYVVTDSVYTRSQAIESLQKEGFTKEQARYGVQNSDFDWSERISCYIDDVLYYKNRIKYTHCPNCYWIYGIYEICPFCKEYTDIYETSSYTKEQVVTELKRVGFTDVEIGRALRYYDDEYFYNENDYKKP